MWTSLTLRAQTLLGLALLVAVLGIATPHFLTADNLLNVLQQSAINAVLAVGLTFVIISGGIDLSVGSVLALSGVMVAHLLTLGWPPALAAAAGVLLGAGVGAINGVVTTIGRIPSFIATLGMMLIARSAAKIFTGSRPISGLPDSFTQLAGSAFGIPIAALVALALYAVAHQVLTRTKLGRYTYAIGGNEQAAWLSGVSVARYKIAIFALSGGLAAVAALLMTARLSAASPLAGEMYELYAIAAAVIGGVSLLGGEGTVVGSLIGALIMGTLANGLNLLNVPSAWEGVAVGVVLIGAVVLDRARHRAGKVTRARRLARRALVVALAALLIAAAAAYRAHGAADGDAVRIAFVPKGSDNPFWLTMKAGAEAEAARRGARVITLAPPRESDVEAQIRIVENLIEQRVAAIMLAPAGSREMVAAVVKANAAGIPILILDSDIDRPTAAAARAVTGPYIGSDNVEGGRLAGAYLAKALGGQGAVAIIEGTAGHESTGGRQRGFAEAIAAHPGMRIVASQPANGERDRAFTVTQNILLGNPDLRGVFAANDAMALGALEAIDAAGKRDEVQLIGFDAEPEAVTHIAAGRMLASVAQYPAEMGRIGVATAFDMLAGATLPAILHTEVRVIDREAAAALAAPAKR